MINVPKNDERLIGPFLKKFCLKGMRFYGKDDKG